MVVEAEEEYYKEEKLLGNPAINWGPRVDGEGG